MLRLRIFLSALLILFSGKLLALDAGETVRLHGQINKDTYAAGGSVFSSANIAGDLMASGGTLIIDGSIQSDLMLVGGDVTVSASIGDDLRIMAGSTLLKSTIGGDLLFAGGQLSLSPDNRVGGEAWLAGGQLDLGGQFGSDLHAAGGKIVLSGHVVGDVRLEADSIRIESGTRIDGRLTYLSPVEATVAPDVIVQGGIVYESRDIANHDKAPGGFLYFTLLVAALVFYRLFANYTLAVNELLRQDYWPSLGIGLAAVLLLPFVAIIFMSVIIGLWLGLMLLAVYALALLCGFFLGMFYSAMTLARLIRFDLNTRIRQLSAIVVVYIILWLLQFVPMVGGLTGFIILLSGLGAGSRVLYRKYQSQNI